jgi:hypothetical protein
MTELTAFSSLQTSSDAYPENNSFYTETQFNIVQKTFAQSDFTMAFAIPFDCVLI